MTDPRIDAYIAEAADWAKPILNHLRSLPAQAVPEATEAIKWGAPFWEYKGLLCGMAVFKTHCAFVLYHDKEIPEIAALYEERDDGIFGSIGRITKLEDLPPDAELIDSIRLVAADNEAQKAKPKGASKRAGPEAMDVPDDLIAALDANETAREQFARFPNGRRNEYIVWITEAKTEATRSKRLVQAIEWIAEGKSRNWKYER